MCAAIFKRPQYVPLFLGWVFTDNFCRFLSDVRGSMRVLQLVHVDVKGHGVRRGQMLTEPEREQLRKTSAHTLDDRHAQIHTMLKKDLENTQGWDLVE